MPTKRTPRQRKEAERRTSAQRRHLALRSALLWLVAGLTATAGGGNVEWLAQFDL